MNNNEPCWHIDELLQLHVFTWNKRANDHPQPISTSCSYYLIKWNGNVQYHMVSIRFQVLISTCGWRRWCGHVRSSTASYMRFMICRSWLCRQYKEIIPGFSWCNCVFFALRDAEYRVNNSRFQWCFILVDVELEYH